MARRPTTRRHAVARGLPRLDLTKRRSASLPSRALQVAVIGSLSRSQVLRRAGDRSRGHLDGGGRCAVGQWFGVGGVRRKVDRGMYRKGTNGTEILAGACGRMRDGVPPTPWCRSLRGRNPRLVQWLNATFVSVTRGAGSALRDSRVWLTARSARRQYLGGLPGTWWSSS